MKYIYHFYVEFDDGGEIGYFEHILQFYRKITDNSAYHLAIKQLEQELDTTDFVVKSMSFLHEIEG